MGSECLYLGFDIGGTKCVVCCGTDAGRVICRTQFPTEKNFKRSWEKLHEATQGLIRNHALVSEDIKAVGISCGGPLDSRRGIIQSPPNLPGWDDVPMVKMVEDEFGFPAFLQNDANACGLAEWRYGAGRGSQNMIFLTMGSGLGAGLILNGQLYEGATGMAGEVGHIRMRDDGPLGFGKHGSFEGFCGGHGMAEHAGKIAANHPDQESIEDYFRITGERNFSVKNLNVAQVRGNRFAKHVFEETGAMLGRGLAVLLDILNPEVIVIGSIFQRSEALLRPAMERALAAEALPEVVAACRIVPAALGDRIGDVAALTVAVNGLKSSGCGDRHHSSNAGGKELLEK